MSTVVLDPSLGVPTPGLLLLLSPLLAREAETSQLHLHVEAGAHARYCMCGGQTTTCRGQRSLSTMWVLPSSSGCQACRSRIYPRSHLVLLTRIYLYHFPLDSKSKIRREGGRDLPSWREASDNPAYQSTPSSRTDCHSGDNYRCVPSAVTLNPSSS